MSERRRKRLSGAEYRRRRREKQVAELQQTARDLGLVVLEPAELERERRTAAAGASTAAPRLAALLERVGEPPLRPGENVLWANNCAAALLWDVLNDPAVEPRDRRRVAADLVFKVGATYSRAFTQQKLSEIAATILPDLRPTGARGEPITEGAWRAFERGERVVGAGDTLRKGHDSDEDPDAVH